MSSSTMIQGATMRRASRMRRSDEPTTIAATHAQAGTATARARTPPIAVVT